MKIESDIIEINTTDNLTTEYIENELTKRNINSLRWAIVNVSDKIYSISVANLKE